MHGGVYFRNFTVYVIKCLRITEKSLTIVKSDFFFVTRKSVPFKAEIGMC